MNIFHLCFTCYDSVFFFFFFGSLECCILIPLRVYSKRSTHTHTPHTHVRIYFNFNIFLLPYKSVQYQPRHRKVNYLVRNYFRHTAFIITRCQLKWQMVVESKMETIIYGGGICVCDQAQQRFMRRIHFYLYTYQRDENEKFSVNWVKTLGR